MTNIVINEHAGNEHRTPLPDAVYVAHLKGGREINVTVLNGHAVAASTRRRHARKAAQEAAGRREIVALNRVA